MKAPEIVAVSDVHLTREDPEGIRRFLSFLDERVGGAGACYLLGDLFDYWLPRRGRIPSVWTPLAAGFHRISGAGTEVLFLHGNRDFLLDPWDARALGGRLAGEACRVESGGRSFYLAHGDRFCTRDRAYQRLRRVLRNPVVKGLAKGLPLPLLEGLARRLRRRSRHAVARKSPSTTTLDLSAVEAVLEEGYDGVVCGHIHRPALHTFPSGKILAVLPDWQGRGGGHAEIQEGRLSLYDREGDESL